MDLHFFAKTPRGEIGFVTSMGWVPHGKMMQVEVILTAGRREYYQPCELELEQKGEL